MVENVTALDERRHLELEFMDGSRMSFSFPLQPTPGYGTRIRLDSLMEKPYLMIEFEDAVTFYPTVNIKSIRTYPAPDDLPEYVIRGAQLEDR
jgi:hypothetical protein